MRKDAWRMGHRVETTRAVLSGMLEPEMIEDTAKIVNEAVKDKVQVNLIINNRAGGNAPPHRRKDRREAAKGKTAGSLLTVFQFRPNISNILGTKIGQRCWTGPQKEMDLMTEVALLLQAVGFAANKHRHQRRKDKEASPYINHPIEVAKALATIGGVTDLSILIAAVLHDTVEDTNTSFSELEKVFGKDVRLLVEEMTDDKKLPKDERKRLQIAHARQLSERAKQIKIADKICNILDITNSPPANWPLERKEGYLEWAEKVVEGCRGSNPNLESYFDEVLSEGWLKLGQP